MLLKGVDAHKSLQCRMKWGKIHGGNCHSFISVSRDPLAFIFLICSVFHQLTETKRNRNERGGKRLKEVEFLVSSDGIFALISEDTLESFASL